MEISKLSMKIAIIFKSALVLMILFDSFLRIFSMNFVGQVAPMKISWLLTFLQH